ATTRPGEEIGRLIEDRSKVIGDILATNLSVPALLDRLELGRRNPKRAAELAALKKQHPDLEALIDRMTAAYDQWSEHKSLLEDPSDLLRMLKGAGVLEFRILATRNPQNPEMLTSPKPEYNERVDKYVEQLKKRGPRPEAGDKYAWFKVAKPRENSILDPGFRDYYVTEQYLDTWYVLAHATPDMGMLHTDKDWSLVSADISRDQNGRPSVDFRLDARGGDKFQPLTRLNLKRPLAIFLDGEAISAATIQSAISTRGEITGNFSIQEVAYLVNTLEAGALPARLKEVPIQERNVGPSLGDTNRRMGQISVAVSLLAVIAFMAIYYAYNGAIADIALLMNLIITLGVMAFIQATFTLPGIAGLILTLGMAVDANVLIFERMREELQRGVSARMAVKLGYERAFSAIFDGNITTILTAVILYWIGSEEIKGFGLTLGLGLAISMFTALFVTRQYYYVMIPLSLNRDETRRAWLLPGILVGVAALMFALGWVLNRTPEAREESNALGLARFLGILAATAVVILGSMWGFRWLYKITGHQKANRLPMMKLMSAPNIDWMSKYRAFWICSAVVITLGMVLLLGKGGEVLDIEFTGGTNVQVALKEQYGSMKDLELAEYVRGNKSPTAVDWLKQAAADLRRAEVADDQHGRFLITVPGRSYSLPQLQALILADPAVARRIVRNGVTAAPGGVAVQFDNTNEELPAPNLAQAQALVREQIPAYVEKAAAHMANARIQGVDEGGRRAFDIITGETARTLVAEAIMASSTRDLLEVTQPIEATLVTRPDKAPDGIFPVRTADNTLADVIGGTDRDDIARFKGGLVLCFENLKPAVTLDEVNRRLRQMRLQPDFEGAGVRTTEVFGLGDPVGTVNVPDASGKLVERQLYNRIAIAVVDANTIYEEGKPSDAWRTSVAEQEKALAAAALASSQALQRVTQFAGQVANEAAQKALIAVILSFLAIAGYLWVRFGALDFGISGIIALYHDVAVALAALVACHYIHDTWIGRLLMLEDFKIDLTVIAALLTLVGYSINDTIVIFDRIRENRGRLGQVSPQLINDSLNQTLSRTVLTAFTVFLTVLIMYVWGGEGIHGFAFVMIIGSISGTYSTLAIATPMVQHPRAMWITTIAIAAVTMAGITWRIENDVIRWVLVLGVV
ncbi:MAG: protein translocase subunit SecD, partial [Phycisphaerae bacterium]